ncbi:50S ribosomal protein L24 [Patescibacteria group bacterium]|nr:50S ribosomal protein L24 [Patescibacteria group bacterium]MBU4512664.1 50S ribosomal protein L24 [Patescibacteria group bacterium]MCG2693569.1 50S ribosomal protein L24 [Candidatus Parcubacteria bacterium]
MKIKTGDQVKVLQGKDKGKKGKVIRVNSCDNKIVIEGINLFIKHVKPKKEREKGQRVQFPAAMDASKVMLICLHCGKQTRVGYKVLESGKKVRVCKKCKDVV